MAVENHIIPLTGLLCGATTLIAQQYHFVGLNSSGTVELTNVGDPGVLGVLLNKPAVGDPCKIAAVGSICEVMAEGVIPVGNLLELSATGTVGVAEDNDYTVGMNLEASAAASEIIRCITWFPTVIADVSAFSTCA